MSIRLFKCFIIIMMVAVFYVPALHATDIFKPWVVRDDQLPWNKPNWAGSLKGKTVVHIDSYNPKTMAWWSGAIRNRVRKLLDPTGVKLIYHYCDTKNPDVNKSEAFGAAKGVVGEKKPDVVIFNDDNAWEYLYGSHYMKSPTPFVFAGINNNLDKYQSRIGRNITGMIEVNPSGLVAQLAEIAGKKESEVRIGFLANPQPAHLIDANMLKGLYGKHLKELYAKTWKEWQDGYIALQKECDVLIVAHTQGFKDWPSDDVVVMKFLHSFTNKPTGCWIDNTAKYCLIGYVKYAADQAEYMVFCAWSIMTGTSPADIPVVTNRRGKFIINRGFGQKTGLYENIPLDVEEMADQILE